MTLGCLIVIIYQLLQFKGKRDRIIPAVALACCTIGYLMVDCGPVRDSLVLYLFLIGAQTLPYVFWIFSRAVFEDRFRLQPWMFWLGGVVAITQFGLYFLCDRADLEVTTSFAKLALIFQYGISLTFVILAINTALVGRKVDLINSRVKFRYRFVLFTAVLITLTLLTEIVFQNEQEPLALELLQKLTLSGLTYYFTFRQLEFKPSFFIEKEKSQSPATVAVTIDRKLLDSLHEQMEVQQIWKTDGLTIRQLAAVY